MIVGPHNLALVLARLRGGRPPERIVVQPLPQAAPTGPGQPAQAAEPLTTVVPAAPQTTLHLPGKRAP